MLFCSDAELCHRTCLPVGASLHGIKMPLPEDVGLAEGFSIPWAALQADPLQDLKLPSSCC